MIRRYRVDGPLHGSSISPEYVKAAIKALEALEHEEGIDDD
jgi:hypothetical protein